MLVNFSFILSPERAVAHLPKLIVPDHLLMQAVNGIKLETSADLQARVAEMEVGDTLEMVVYRDRQKQTVTVTVIEQIPETEKQ